MSSKAILRNYFSRFPEFTYDESKETVAQFNLLAQQNNWSDKERKDKYLDLQTALALQFNEIYGEDPDDLRSWEKLCRAIGADPIPETVADCRKLFKRTHVNLVDLVDAHGTTRRVRTFPNRFKLARYTRRNEKFFNKRQAKEGGLLKFLLRQIMNPGSGPRR